MGTRDTGTPSRYHHHYHTTTTHDTAPTSLPPRHSPTHHVAHQLPLLRGEVPRDRLLRHGQREADRRDGRLREAARIRQHRRHDPALGTVPPTYPVHPETDPRRPQ